MMNTPPTKSYSKKKRLNRRIILPFEEENYVKLVESALNFRQFLDEMIVQYPELFPENIGQGYRMKDIYYSKKLGLPIRRLEICNVAYSVRPSFVLPYLVSKSKDVENALFLRKFNVPYWALAKVFGKSHSFYYRIESSLGRNSLVGTTIKSPSLLPEHCVADEKFVSIKGKRAYLATTVSNECILGVELAMNADEKDLGKAYSVFKEEAQNVDPDYNPKSVNVDGWKSTTNAWKILFPSILVIRCFLHIYIKLRACSKKKYQQIFSECAEKLWDCYKAITKESFLEQVRALYAWALEKEDFPETMLKPLSTLYSNKEDFAAAYDFEGAKRTSNMVDRKMQRLEVHLKNTKEFHGTIESANLNIRGWALIQNFAPSNPYTVQKYKGVSSPAQRLNGFSYHSNWLQNLLTSASLGGFRPPQNPLQ